MAQVNYNINFEPFKKQRIIIDYVINKGVDEILAGGAAGMGKSHVAAFLAAYYALNYPGINIGISTPLKTQGLDTIKPKLDLMVPKVAINPVSGKRKKLWHFSAQSSEDTFIHDENDPSKNSVIRYSFNNLERKGMLENSWQGREFQISIFDEATRQPLDGIKYIANSRNRKSGTCPNAPRKIIYLTNSGGISAQYFKKHFVDRYKLEKEIQNTPFPIWEEPLIDPETKKQFIDKDTGKPAVVRRAYIPATVLDNPMYANTSYHFQLAQLPKKEREFKLYGNWDYVPGKFFEDFDRTRHTLPADEIDRILLGMSESDDLLWSVSMDYGGRSDGLRILFVVNDKDDRDIVYKEYNYVGYSDEYVANDLKAKINHFGRRYGWTRKPTLILPHDTFRTANQKIVQEGTGEVLGETTAELYEKLLNIEPIKASKNRTEGWRSISRQLVRQTEEEMLINSDDHGISSYLLISQECKLLIAEMESLQADENNIKDILRHQDDHSSDAFRYYMISKYRARAISIAEEDEYAIKNPTSHLARKQLAIQKHRWESFHPDSEFEERGIYGYDDDYGFTNSNK